MDRFYSKDGKYFKETKWVQIVSFNKAKLNTGDSPWGVLVKSRLEKRNRLFFCFNESN